jgi:hypothetical protein
MTGRSFSTSHNSVRRKGIMVLVLALVIVGVAYGIIYAVGNWGALS